jgi:hypothetical protein
MRKLDPVIEGFDEDKKSSFGTLSNEHIPEEISISSPQRAPISPYQSLQNLLDEAKENRDLKPKHRPPHGWSDDRIEIEEESSDRSADGRVWRDFYVLGNQYEDDGEDLLGSVEGLSF